MISRFQDGVSFQLNPLVTTGRLRILRRIVTSQIRRYKQIALEFKITCSLFHIYHDLNMTNHAFCNLSDESSHFHFGWSQYC
jgi:hypothetical protein